MLEHDVAVHYYSTVSASRSQGALGFLSVGFSFGFKVSGSRVRTSGSGVGGLGLVSILVLLWVQGLGFRDTPVPLALALIFCLLSPGLPLPHEVRCFTAVVTRVIITVLVMLVASSAFAVSMLP